MKLPKILLTSLILILPLSQLYAHALQVAYCKLNNQTIRVFVEHWHGTGTPNSSYGLNVTITENASASTYNVTADGQLYNTTINNISVCGSSINHVKSTSGANTYNEWAYFDFVPTTSGTYQIRINNATNAYLAEMGSIFSDNISENISLASIKTQPSNTTVCVGTNAQFSVDTSGSFSSFKWQQNTGSTWADIANSDNDTLALTNVTLSMNNNQYRCIAIGASSDTSSAATLTVNAPTINSVLSTVNPTASDYSPYSCTDITASASGNGTLSYHWNPAGSSTNAGNPLNICPTSGTSYTLTVTDGDGCQSTASHYQHVVKATSPYRGRIIMCYLVPRRGYYTIHVYPNYVSRYLNAGASLGTCSRERKKEESFVSMQMDELYKIYPNPVQSNLNIEWFNIFNEHVNIQLIDMTGRVVKVLFDQDVYENEISLIHENLQDLPQGMYWVKYNSDTQYKVDKLQIVR